MNGTARIEPAAFAAPAYPEAQFVVVVSVREAFPNCPRYIHKYALVERSQFVPHAGCNRPPCRVEADRTGHATCCRNGILPRSRSRERTAQQGLVLVVGRGVGVVLIVGGIGLYFLRGNRAPRSSRRSRPPTRPWSRRPSSRPRRRARCRRARSLPLPKLDESDAEVVGGLTELLGGKTRSCSSSCRSA